MADPGSGTRLRHRSDEGDRGLHMAVRLRRTAEERGIGREGIEALERAHALAMVPRRADLPSQRDARFLHPGRTVLALLDAGETEPTVLSAATLMESEDEKLRTPAGRIRDALGSPVATLVASLPLPGDEDLAERLVTAGRGLRLAALAERLDHLRHAHLWQDREARRRAHALAVEVYGPVAERTDALLARRYAWWIGMFESQHL